MLPSSQACLEMLCGANEDFAFEQLVGLTGIWGLSSGGPFPPGHKLRGVFVAMVLEVAVSLQL